MIEASWIAGLGVILFSIGLLGAFTRKNAIVAGASHYSDVDGWVFTAIAIAIAAAEVAIGLAILLSLYSTQETISLEEANLLRN